MGPVGEVGWLPGVIPASALTIFAALGVPRPVTVSYPSLAPPKYPPPGLITSLKNVV